MSRTMMLFLIFFLLAFFLLTCLFAYTLKYIALAAEWDRYQQNKHPVIHPVIEAIELDKLQRLNELENRVNSLLELFSDATIGDFEVTAYAPLDPNAMPGMCYSGDPNVTASGAPPVPYVTAAAGPSVPFGSRVYIEGLGWRTVNDRGGRIGDRQLDVVVESNREARLFGRQMLRVIIIPTIPGVM